MFARKELKHAFKFPHLNEEINKYLTKRDSNVQVWAPLMKQYLQFALSDKENVKC